MSTWIMGGRKTLITYQWKKKCFYIYTRTPYAKFLYYFSTIFSPMCPLVSAYRLRGFLELLQALSITWSESYIAVHCYFYDVFSHDVLVEAKWDLAQLSKKHVCFNHLASCKCCSNSTTFLKYYYILVVVLS